MKIRTAETLGRIALFSACVALAAELSIVPAVRALPEVASFWSLWVLLITSIVCAFAAILIGSASLRVERSKTALLGCAVGFLVYGLIVTYGVVQWLIYL